MDDILLNYKNMLPQQYGFAMDSFISYSIQDRNVLLLRVESKMPFDINVLFIFKSPIIHFELKLLMLNRFSHEVSYQL